MRSRASSSSSTPASDGSPVLEVDFEFSLRSWAANLSGDCDNRLRDRVSLAGRADEEEAEGDPLDFADLAYTLDRRVVVDEPGSETLMGGARGDNTAEDIW